ncbi:MAG: hypothetical protein M1828_000712 [Chrysothrix sp. TS-e1954]|nr:MAG: hypothetical protein M1828_000712 [Chrysothrix sp. TS-e1954]
MSMNDSRYAPAPKPIEPEPVRSEVDQRLDDIIQRLKAGWKLTDDELAFVKEETEPKQGPLLHNDNEDERSKMLRDHEDTQARRELRAQGRALIQAARKQGPVVEQHEPLWEPVPYFPMTKSATFLATLASKTTAMDPAEYIDYLRHDVHNGIGKDDPYLLQLKKKLPKVAVAPSASKELAAKLSYLDDLLDLDFSDPVLQPASSSKSSLDTNQPTEPMAMPDAAEAGANGARKAASTPPITSSNDITMASGGVEQASKDRRELSEEVVEFTGRTPGPRQSLKTDRAAGVISAAEPELSPSLSSASKLPSSPVQTEPKPAEVSGHFTVDDRPDDDEFSTPPSSPKPKFEPLKIPAAKSIPVSGVKGVPRALSGTPTWPSRFAYGAPVAPAKPSPKLAPRTPAATPKDSAQPGLVNSEATRSTTSAQGLHVQPGPNSAANTISAGAQEQPLVNARIRPTQAQPTIQDKAVPVSTAPFPSTPIKLDGNNRPVNTVSDSTPFIRPHAPPMQATPASRQTLSVDSSMSMSSGSAESVVHNAPAVAALDQQPADVPVAKDEQAEPNTSKIPVPSSAKSDVEGNRGPATTEPVPETLLNPFAGAAQATGLKLNSGSVSSGQVRAANIPPTAERDHAANKASKKTLRDYFLPASKQASKPKSEIEESARSLAPMSKAIAHEDDKKAPSTPMKAVSQSFSSTVEQTPLPQEPLMNWSPPTVQQINKPVAQPIVSASAQPLTSLQQGQNPSGKDSSDRTSKLSPQAPSFKPLAEKSPSKANSNVASAADVIPEQTKASQTSSASPTSQASFRAASFPAHLYPNFSAGYGNQWIVPRDDENEKRLSSAKSSLPVKSFEGKRSSTMYGSRHVPEVYTIEDLHDPATGASISEKEVADSITEYWARKHNQSLDRKTHPETATEPVVHPQRSTSYAFGSHQYNRRAPGSQPQSGGLSDSKWGR